MLRVENLIIIKKNLGSSQKITEKEEEKQEK